VIYGNTVPISKSTSEPCSGGEKVEFLDHNDIFQAFLREVEAHSVDEGLATNHWRQRCIEIGENARTGSPFDFLRWPSLTDFSVPEAWIPRKFYDDLRSSPEWARRWFPLTRESKLGSPKDFSPDFGTSPILVQHASHLQRYEAATGRSIIDCDVVFEIGGGYGSFCRVLKNSGFTGLHIIYDLPHISSIQRLYLALSGLEEVSSQAVSKRNAHGFCLITDDNLDHVSGILRSSKLRTAFVATWSLSETPMSVRERIVPRFLDICDRYLIAFQPAWETISNVDYFATLPAGRVDLTWRDEAIPPTTSRYLLA
jgi:hypothetical protein